MALADKLVLNVVDASAISVMNQVKSQSLRGTLIPFHPVSNRIAALIDVVINATGGQQRSIGVLRLWGHGMLDGPGGSATMVSDDEQGWGGFSLKEMLDDAVLRVLPRLQPYFAVGARVEFKHCRVATKAGWDWLVYLSDQWGVEIHASDRLQHLCSWSGEVLTFKPGRSAGRVRGIDPT
jgi:hypothetical protein